MTNPGTIIYDEGCEYALKGQYDIPHDEVVYYRITPLRVLLGEAPAEFVESRGASDQLPQERNNDQALTAKLQESEATISALQRKIAQMEKESKDESHKIRANISAHSMWTSIEGSQLPMKLIPGYSVSFTYVDSVTKQMHSIVGTVYDTTTIHCKVGERLSSGPRDHSRPASQTSRPSHQRSSRWRTSCRGHNP